MIYLFSCLVRKFTLIGSQPTLAVVERKLSFVVRDTNNISAATGG